jgi:hypothetical protein
MDLRAAAGPGGAGKMERIMTRNKGLEGRWCKGIAVEHKKTNEQKRKQTKNSLESVVVAEEAVQVQSCSLPTPSQWSSRATAAEDATT